MILFTVLEELGNEIVILKESLSLRENDSVEVRLEINRGSSHSNKSNILSPLVG